MYRIDVFEKAAEKFGYKLDYVKYDGNMHILFAEGFIPNLPYKVKWDSMGSCTKLNGTHLPQFNLPISSVYADRMLESINDNILQNYIQLKQIIEKAAELCGYEVYVYNIPSVKIHGFIPGVEGRFYWDFNGFCYRRKDNKRMLQYDLPLQSAHEQLKLEQFKNVCG